MIFMIDIKYFLVDCMTECQRSHWNINRDAALILAIICNRNAALILAIICNRKAALIH